MNVHAYAYMVVYPTSERPRIRHALAWYMHVHAYAAGIPITQKGIRMYVCMQCIHAWPSCHAAGIPITERHRAGKHDSDAVVGHVQLLWRGISRARRFYVRAGCAVLGPVLRSAPGAERDLHSTCNHSAVLQSVTS